MFKSDFAQEEETSVKPKRQRLGDLEYENQIAMAMMASATHAKPQVVDAAACGARLGGALWLFAS